MAGKGMGNDPKAERHEPWSDAQQDVNWKPSLTGHVIFSFRFWPTAAILDSQGHPIYTPGV